MPLMLATRKLWISHLLSGCVPVDPVSNGQGDGEGWCVYHEGRELQFGLVWLQGRVVALLAEDLFLLDDGTGQLRVPLPSGALHHSRMLRPGDCVQVVASLPPEFESRWAADEGTSASVELVKLAVLSESDCSRRAAFWDLEVLESCMRF